MTFFAWTKRIYRLFTYYFNIIYATYLTRMTKWLLHQISGKSQLERCILAKDCSAVKCQNIEKCLAESRIDDLRKIIKNTSLINDTEQEEYALQIVKYKAMPLIHQPVLKNVLWRITHYNYLLNQIESIRKTQFSYQNREHCEYLIKLWSALKPDKALESDKFINEGWTDLGFQNKNPSNDFRGMGLLGLINLNYFTNSLKFNEMGKSTFSRSNHPLYGYSFAIVGINITSWVYKWLHDGNLKTHFFNEKVNITNNDLPIEIFNFIYCIIFMEFDRFWTTNEVEMIFFEQYAKSFRKCIARKLNESNFKFNTSPADADIKNYYILKSSEIEKVSKSQCCIQK